VTVAEARAAWEEHETERHLQSDSIVREALRLVESDGIVFIDEVDKIVEGR
jgi:ATP-dependent HslUV protease ATP-binding subunit HslU